MGTMQQILDFIFLMAIGIIIYFTAYAPIKKTTYIFKPEPTEIHENNNEICYGWKYVDRYQSEKLVRICEEK